MPKINFENRILLGITDGKGLHCRAEEKLEALNKLKIKKAALFLEELDQAERKKIYRALLDSTLKKNTALPREKRHGGGRICFFRKQIQNQILYDP